MFALIDCNNFFASCERLFRPDLTGKPIIVLSSNDGCAVARSNEAKALGIKMGEPLHELKRRFTVVDGTRVQQTTNPRAHSASGGREGRRGWSGLTASKAMLAPYGGTSPSPNYGFLDAPLCNAPDLIVFSANFELYGDISRRVAAVLARITPRIELYSIDEAFLDISKLDIRDYDAWGKALAAKVEREVGIPVSVGIAPTKTLCKLAADHAKKHPECQSCICISNATAHSASASEKRAGECGLSASTAMLAPEERQASLENWRRLLTTTPIHDIWGIGWRLAPRLKAEGVHTAADLATMPPKRAQQLMGIHGRRTVAELNGIACIPLSSTHKPQQVISRGRQFGRDTNDLDTISAAIARMTNHACQALRREGLLATRATVWLMTNRKKPVFTTLHTDTYFYTPTADTGHIARQLIALQRRNFNPQHAWHKAEVTLWGLVPDSQLQTDVFGLVDPDVYAHSSSLMTALDTINHRYGKGTLRYATEDLSHDWYPRRTMQSPAYTSSWGDIPDAQALDF